MHHTTRIISDSLNLIETGKTFATRIGRCDTLVENAEALVKYEKLGIDTINPLPSTLLEETKVRRSEIIADQAQSEADKAIAKSQLASTTRQKVTAINSALLKIRELAQEYGSRTELEPIIRQLKEASHGAQLNGFLEEARKAEFKGNVKKAIDQYQEALYFIKNDEIPDEVQNREMSEIEVKIRELSGPQGS